MLCGLFPKTMDERAFSSQNQFRLKVCSSLTLACFILFIYSTAHNPWNFLLSLSQPQELLDKDNMLWFSSEFNSAIPRTESPWEGFLKFLKISVIHMLSVDLVPLLVPEPALSWVD